MTGQNRIFDDLSRLMTNAMGVAQGAKDEAETALKGWVDRWLAERDFVTREEFEAVREMTIKARTENAELRAMIQAMGGQPQTGNAPAPVAPVSEVEAPASAMTAGDSASAAASTGQAAPGHAPHVSEVEAPPSAMKATDAAAARPAGTAVSEVEAPPSAMTAGNASSSETLTEEVAPVSEVEAPPSAMVADESALADRNRGQAGADSARKDGR